MAPELVPTVTKSTASFTSPTTLPPRAYVTFLAGNGDYVKGVVGLAKGLRKVKTAYPLVVACLPDVPEDHRKILKSQGCIVREIEPVTHQKTRPSSLWLITSSTIPSSVYGRYVNYYYYYTFFILKIIEVLYTLN